MNDTTCNQISLEMSDSANKLRSEILSSPSSTPVAVLFEGRQYGWDLDTLNYLLDNSIQSIPSSWVIHAFLRQNALDHLLKLPWFAANTRIAGKIILHLLPESFKLNKQAYNQLLSQSTFWASFSPASHVHIFELDTGYCDNSDKKLTDFTEFDYCGARWVYSCRNSNMSDPTRCVGNSGFSIWNRFMMEELAKKYILPINPINEGDALIDQFWGDQMRAHWPNVKICSSDDADYFSVETIYDGQKKPIGWHKPYFDRWPQTAQNIFLENCPSYRLITAHQPINKTKK